MARTKDTTDGSRLSLGAQKSAAQETARLVWRYILQETTEPLKSLAIRAVFMVVAVTSLAVGFIACLFGLLRALQTETGTTFAGGWNFAPYLLTAAAAVLVIGISALIGLKAGKRSR